MEYPKRVVLKSSWGTKRFLELPTGELLPRILLEMHEYSIVQALLNQCEDIAKEHNATKIEKIVCNNW